jgi:hypothetical protein
MINTYIDKEFEEFRQYHKNIYNIIFHILCGIFYITAFFLLFGKYKYIFLIIYSFILLITIQNITTMLKIFTIIYIILLITDKNIFNFKYLITIIIIFYFLPELSHYITNENTILNINNITPINILFNFFYLLPFSFMCLTNSK